MTIPPVRVAVVGAVVLAAGLIAVARPYGPVGTSVTLALLLLAGLIVVALPGATDAAAVRPAGQTRIGLPEIGLPEIGLAERWTQACTEHDAVLSAYGAYELDPEQLLKYPGLWDLTAQPVMNFHDALELADTLRSDSYPGEVAATEYIGAVAMLRTDWNAAEGYAQAADTRLRRDSDR